MKSWHLVAATARIGKDIRNEIHDVQNCVSGEHDTGMADGVLVCCMMSAVRCGYINHSRAGTVTRLQYGMYYGLRG